MTDNLHISDRELLRAVLGGRDVVELTPALVQQMQACITERKAVMALEYPKLLDECSYKTKLAVTAWVFGHICDHATTGGSFRYLIYDRLGFGPDAYLPLYEAGGMVISNEFDLSGDGED